MTLDGDKLLIELRKSVDNCNQILNDEPNHGPEEIIAADVIRDYAESIITCIHKGDFNYGQS